MTELDAGLVRRKLAVITRNLSELTAVEGLSLEDYRADRLRQKGVERLLQETVEAAVDANLHLLRAAGGPTPADYYESFVQLGRQHIVPSALAEQLAPAAGLRNRLVHEYDEIDDSLVLRAVAEARDQFARYVGAVEKHLSDQGL